MPNFAIAKSIPTSHCKVNRQVRDDKHMDKAQYALDVAEIDINHIINTSDNIDTITDEYHKKYTKILNKHAPYKTL